MSLALASNELTSLSADVRVGIIPFDPDDRFHQRALFETIHGTLAAHGVGSLQQKNFARVIAASRLKRVEAEFIVASIEHCRPMIAGGAILTPDAVLAFRKGGVAVLPALHAEDTYLSRGISKVIREISGVGLGTWYMQERLRRAKGIAAFTSEYAPHNLPIINTYKKFGSLLGSEEDSAIFQLPASKGRRTSMSHPIETEDLAQDVKDGVLFLSRCPGDDGHSEIFALFSEGLSTVGGVPVIRAHLASKGLLPPMKRLKEMIAGVIEDGCDHIHACKEKEGRSPWQHLPTPLYIEVLQNPLLVQALREMDFPHRLFCGKKMLPARMKVGSGQEPTRDLRCMLKKSAQAQSELAA